MVRWLLLVLIGYIKLTSARLEWHLIDNGTRSPSPTARRDAALGYSQVWNRLVVFGGRTVIKGDVTVLGDTIIYDFLSGSWRHVSPRSSEGTTPQPRFATVYGSANDSLFLATGQGEDGVFYDDMWQFDFNTETWSKLPQQPKPNYYTQDQWLTRVEDATFGPEPRYGAAGGIFHGSSRFYLAQGLSDVRHGNTFSYNTDALTWRQEFPDYGPYSADDPHARYLHAGTMVSSDELLIFGGCLSGAGGGGSCPSADSWIFNGKLNSWTKQRNCATARTHSTLALLPVADGQRRVLLFGGDEHGPGYQILIPVRSSEAQVAIFNPDTGDWSLRQTIGRLPSKRASVAMVTGPTGVYMFGGYETETDTMKNDLYLLLGDAFAADQAPIDNDCRQTFFNLIMLHGILMALAWGFFIPWGSFIAIYFKHKDPLWFNLHRLFQIFGLTLAVVGFVCGVLSVENSHFKCSHAIIGLTTMLLGILQPINAACRPDPPKKGSQHKTLRRLLWELIHTFGGRTAVLLGMVNISLGVFLAHAALILWVVWFVYLGAVILVFYIQDIVYHHWKGKKEADSIVTSQNGSGFVARDVIPAEEMPPAVVDGIETDESSVN